MVVGMIVVGSLTTFIDQHRQWALLLLFGLVLLESFGLPLPGETALIACAVLASQGALAIESVIAIAILAAVLGDNLGYWTARRGGRALLLGWSMTRRPAERYLATGERFFARHGGKTVFIGRFVPVLRFTAAWVAGLSRMHWWRFFAWNAAGGIVWATGVGLVSYFLGSAVANAIGTYGLLAGGGAIVLATLGYLVVRRLQKRTIDHEP